MISVIVPIYNVEEYLTNCIDSIVNQTYGNLEIILVDDGSIDNSTKICDIYANKDRRIRVIHKRNEGLVRARKTGLKLANGEYVIFVDGDDWIEPCMCEELLKIIQQSEADMVHSGYFRDSVVNIPPIIHYKKNKYSTEKILKEHILNPNADLEITSSIWSKIFKLSTIKKCYELVPDNMSYGEDLLNLIVCVCEKIEFVSIGKSYYHYTVRNNSISHKSEISNYRQELDLCDAIVKILNHYEVYENLRYEMSKFLSIQMAKALKKNISDKFMIQVYKLPNGDRLIGKKVVLYGAGSVGVDFYSQISRIKECEIVAWVDEKKQENEKIYCDISSMEVISQIDYDIIVVGIRSVETCAKIKSKLIHLGVSEDKIICEMPELG